MISSGAIVGDDGRARCPWADAPSDYRAYHDEEWGRPVHGEIPLFERLTLESFQSGLSWLTILRKRDNFRQAFEGFDPTIVAAYEDLYVERLMADTGIVRNRRKIEAAITNARALCALWEAGETLDGLLWSAADSGPRDRPLTSHDVPASTASSQRLARELRARGFVFIGPTTLYAAMQACGIVDDHLNGCHVRGTNAVTTG